MTPFHTRFPEVAARETRCIRVVTTDGPLPLGEYGFLELYCEDPGCDCHSVLLQVTSSQAPHTPLATINFGWKSAPFYTRWMHGDAAAGRELTAASLDSLQPQSKYAGHLLDCFREQLMTDPDYIARLARHYEMFKAMPHGQTPSPAAGVAFPSEKPIDSPMTTAEILQQLQHVPEKADFAPYKAALLAAIEQREAITPALIAAMDRVSADPAHYMDDQEDCLHLFAIYLLAQFREPRALDCFLRFFSLPGEHALDLTNDMVAEYGPAILASVCGGDPAPLLKLTHDESVNELVRDQALQGLMVQMLWGERPRDVVVEELRGLFHTLPKPGNAYVWASLTGAVCDFHILELAPEARQAFAEGLVDESILDLSDLEQEMAGDGQENLDYFRERNAPIDAVDQCAQWLCFSDEEDDFKPWNDAVPVEAPEEDLLDEVDDDAFAHEIAYGKQPCIAPPKVGRNDPCPCGSGKKFKKCCGL